MGRDLLARGLAVTRSALSTARGAARLYAVATVLVCMSAQPASGQDRLEREGSIKAGLILNIAKLVTWPADGATELSVCVLGAAQFVTPLRVIGGNVVQGRRVTVREIPEPRDVAGCHIVFVGAEMAGRLEEVQAAGADHPVLTVGDVPNFAERGGVIGFTSRRNRVRLELNVQTAEASGLLISSQLVRLAKIVEGRTGSESP